MVLRGPRCACLGFFMLLGVPIAPVGGPQCCPGVPASTRGPYYFFQGSMMLLRGRHCSCQGSLPLLGSPLVLPGVPDAARGPHSLSDHLLPFLPTSTSSRSSARLLAFV